MTLATPPERSGSGSAVQNTVRQVGAVFGVAILSSVVGTVYSNNITSAAGGQGPAAGGVRRGHRFHRRYQRGRRSAGGRRERAAGGDRPAAAGRERVVHAGPAHRGVRLRGSAGSSPSWSSCSGCPAKAEAVVWTGTGPGSAPNAGPAITDAESQVHLVDETGDDLSAGRRPASAGRHARRDRRWSPRLRCGTPPNPTRTVRPTRQDHRQDRHEVLHAGAVSAAVIDRIVAGREARRPGRPREERVDRAIIAATLEIFAEDGYHATLDGGRRGQGGGQQGHHLPALAGQA